jgi:hypothetical protein
MEFAIKLDKMDDGGYRAYIDQDKHDGPNVGLLSGVVYSDSAFEAYFICKTRLESKGHKVVE